MTDEHTEADTTVTVGDTVATVSYGDGEGEIAGYDEGAVKPQTRQILTICCFFVCSFGLSLFLYAISPAASETYSGPLAVASIIVGLAAAFGVNELLKYHQRSCGCRVKEGSYGYSVVETAHEWTRTEDGAKVRWEQYRTELRRCEKCGDHYHTEVDEPVKTREAWAEEEPEIMPDGTDHELGIDQEI